MDINDDYKPVWEGETKNGIKKKIFVIIGKIDTTPIPENYEKIKDRYNNYLKDSEGNLLLVPKEIDDVFNYENIK